MSSIAAAQAAAAEDTLLVYFAGHSRIGNRNELCLCLPDTILTNSHTAHGPMTSSDEWWPTAPPPKRWSS